MSTMATRDAKRPRIYVSRSDIPRTGLELLRAECDVEIWDQASPVPREELMRKVEGKDALLCTLCDKIDSEVLDRAGSSLKVVSTMSVGYDHIQLNSCKERHIRVGYTPDVLTDATAELTVGLLLATTRRLVEANKEVYNGGWKSWSPTWMCGNGLKGSTVGLVGFGRIGQEVAKRLVPFKIAEIRTSDIVIASCALTPQTESLFNEAAFGQMKRTAVFINVSRGAVVDQAALHVALKSGTIMSAGLDVTTPEPLPRDDPLLSLSNVVILPHIGSADVGTRAEMSLIAARNILNALNGENMIAEVHFDEITG